MYAISFDLVVADTAQNHPKGISQAYADIGYTLRKFGFTRIQEVCTPAKTKIWLTCFQPSTS